jgi:hypothetical protein
MVAVPFMSKRFAMKRFLGLTSEEIAENESMWKEENVDSDVALSASAELRGQGVTANGIAGDLGGLETASSTPPPGAETDAAGMPGQVGSPEGAGTSPTV